MSFAIPYNFDNEAESHIVGFQIVNLQEGFLEPKAIVRVKPDLQLMTPQNLADNCAALWDQRNPEHFSDGKHEMRSQPFFGGLDLYVRKKENGGVSERCATLTALPGYEEALMHSINPESPTFKLFMKSGWNPEQRREPRPAGKGKPLAPSQAPRPSM